MSGSSRRTAAIIGLVALIFAILAWRQLGPAHTPSPQPPLEPLAAANFHDFRDAFNADSTATRLVLLLSPT
jgi:hypothetical protein